MFKVAYEVVQANRGYKILGSITDTTKAFTGSLCVSLEEEINDFYYVHKGPVLKQVEHHQKLQHPVSVQKVNFIYQFNVFVSHETIQSEYAERKFRLKLLTRAGDAPERVQYVRVEVNKIPPPKCIQKMGDHNGQSYSLLMCQQLYLHSDFVVYLDVAKVQITLIDTYSARVVGAENYTLKTTETKLFRGSLNKRVVINKSKYKGLVKTFHTNNVTHNQKLQIAFNGQKVLIPLEVVNGEEPPPQYECQLPAYYK